MNEPTKWTPPVLTASDSLFANDEQIQAVVKIYVDEMRERGHIVGNANAAHLEQVARIWDVWRGAFAHVLKADTSPAPDLGALLQNFGIDNMKRSAAPPMPPMQPGTSILPPGALQELLDAARAVLDDYESLLDSDYSGSHPWEINMPEAAAVCKRLRDLLP